MPYLLWPLWLFDHSQSPMAQSLTCPPPSRSAWPSPVRNHGCSRSPLRKIWNPRQGAIRRTCPQARQKFHHQVAPKRPKGVPGWVRRRRITSFSRYCKGHRLGTGECIKGWLRGKAFNISKLWSKESQVQIFFCEETFLILPMK